MSGKIKPRGKCPKCGKPFVLVESGYECKRHLTRPKRFRLFVKGEYIYSDKQGLPLDSFTRAYRLLSHIDQEIRDGTFDLSKYVRSEQTQFYVDRLCRTLIDDRTPALAPSYKKDFKRELNRIAAYFKNFDVREIRKPHIIDFAKSLKHYAPKTQKNILDTLKTFLYWVKDDREMILNVPAIPVVDRDVSIPRWINKEDQMKILEKVPFDDRAIIEFLMTYGTRPGEARALRIQDIDLPNGVIRITCTFSGDQIRPRRKGRGAPPLTLPILENVRPYLEKRVKEALPGAFVFPNPRTAGKAYGQAPLSRLWNRIRKLADIDQSFRLYDASRHSVASQLRSKGVGIEQVREILGHTDIRTTMIYSHADLESKRASLEILTANKVVEMNKS